MARRVLAHVAWNPHSRHATAACGSTAVAYGGRLCDASFFRAVERGSAPCPRCARIAAKRNGGEPHHFLLAS